MVDTYNLEKGGVCMTRKRSPYKAEFREKLVLLSRKG